VLDDRTRRVLDRLERTDAEERSTGVPRGQRARQIRPTTGRLLSALVAHHPACRVLELGGSRGYSTIWLAAAVRVRGGRVISIEHDPRKAEAWRANIEEAGLEGSADLLQGDAFELLAGLDQVFDVAFIDAEKEDYERLFALVRENLEPGAVVVADNVVSHAETLGAYSAARQADPTLASVTVPLDSGLEISVLLG
jgi:caffeoyl-CoA O-methyltransferase